MEILVVWKSRLSHPGVDVCGILPVCYYSDNLQTSPNTAIFPRGYSFIRSVHLKWKYALVSRESVDMGPLLASSFWP